MTKQYKLICGDCEAIMAKMPEGCVDLVISSPPYEDCRSYGELDFKYKGAEWVGWMLAKHAEATRVCKGLVAFVVSDKTEDYAWTATVPLYIAALKAAGAHLRRPPLYVRHGIPGSGGKDWLANRYELVVCTTAGPGPLPWAEPTACGAPPKCKPGGPLSHRKQSGHRTKGKRIDNPKRANPGNIINCGSNTQLGYSNETDAPFPEKLASFFIRSFCPPGGIVLDPFCGSSTTGVAALRAGRRYIGIDIRENQIELSEKRLKALNAGFGL